MTSGMDDNDKIAHFCFEISLDLLFPAAAFFLEAPFGSGHKRSICSIELNTAFFIS